MEAEPAGAPPFALGCEQSTLLLGAPVPECSSSGAVVDGAESPSFTTHGGIPAYRPANCSSPGPGSEQPWQADGVQLAAQGSLTGGAEAEECSLGGSGLLDTSLREQMVRQLLSRNAEVLQRLQDV